MGPLFALAESASTFNASTALELLKTVITWILDVIKGEPILAAAFVVGVLCPAGFSVIRRTKRVSR